MLFNDFLISEEYQNKIFEVVMEFYRNIEDDFKNLKSYIPEIEEHYFESWQKFLYINATEYLTHDFFFNAVDEEISCIKTQIFLANEIKAESRKKSAGFGFDKFFFNKPTALKLGCSDCGKKCSLKKLQFKE